MAPERGKKSPSTVAAECGADEILIVSMELNGSIYVKLLFCNAKINLSLELS